jgi:DNA (cytosine-5)-methyltransferase 1
MWNNFTFIDLFAGIGGFRLALDALGGECVFSSDYDRYAQLTYEANFGEKPYGDITSILETDIPAHDVLCGGFPCQPFSIAGVSKKNSLGRKHGFDDEKQGNLFFHILRIVNHHQPKILFLENVKNLKSHDKGITWKIITQELRAAGYMVFAQVINGKHYVPQHRERIFIVCFRDNVFPMIDFQFPTLPLQRLYTLNEMLEKEVDEKYTITAHLWDYLQRRKIAQQDKGNGFGFGLVDPSTDHITRTLSARYYKDGSEILIYQGEGKSPRRLTPRECARLQGFPESFKIVVSDTQAYRQFGNSVVMPAIHATFAEILKTVRAYGQQKPHRTPTTLWHLLEDTHAAAH